MQHAEHMRGALAAERCDAATNFTWLEKYAIHDCGYYTISYVV